MSILESGEGDGEVGRVRSVAAQADDSEHKDDPARAVPTFEMISSSSKNAPR
jgi:hypothetical protein